MIGWWVALGAVVLSGATASAGADGPRPAWLDRGPVVDDGVWAWSVPSGWWATPEEALGHAEAEAARAIVRSFTDARVRRRYLHTALATLMANGTLVADSYTQRSRRTYGTMVQVHLLVELGSHHRAWLVSEAERLAGQAARRWVWRGVLGAIAVLVVGMGYGWLDQRTLGYATGRLRLGAGLVLVAVGAVIWHCV